MTLDELAAERFCLAVEDSAATATFLAENRVAPVYLIDRPWNRQVKGDDISRMKNWRELADRWPAPAASSYPGLFLRVLHRLDHLRFAFHWNPRHDFGALVLGQGVELFQQRGHGIGQRAELQARLDRVGVAEGVEPFVFTLVGASRWGSRPLDGFPGSPGPAR